MALSLLALLTIVSCSQPRTYIAAADYIRETPQRQPLLLQPGDKVQVLVKGQDTLTTEVDVRPGGEIVLPVAGSLDAANKSPSELANVVASKLAGIISEPQVTVVVTSRKTRVTLLGEIRTPGRFELEPRDGVLDAIAKAGGLTAFASRDCIFVLRHSPKLARIRFNYDDLTAADGTLLGFQLRDGDIIVAE